MALADFSALSESIRNPSQDASFVTVTTTSAAGRLYNMWTQVVPAGVNPTSAVVPTRTTTGALDIQNAAADLGLVAARLNLMNPGAYLLCDLLSHQGGLSGTVTTAQTTNLPTAALTRYTSGVGVMCMLTIMTQIGTTATTATVSYTNTTPTSGRTSPLVVFGGTGFREVRRSILIPNQSGDNGFTSVESVTVAVTTGTAGNFGVTLFKPLAMIIADEQHGVSAVDLISGRLSPGLPQIEDNACLFLLGMSQSTNISGAGALLLTEW